MRLRLLLVAMAVGLAVLGVATTATTAQAHAALVRSSPESQARLPAPPAAIDLWFTEPLEARFSTLFVYNSSGATIAVSAITVDPADPKRLSGRLPALRPGIYTVGYRTLSTLDGHEWTGAYSFVVLDANGAAPGDSAFVPDLAAGSTWQNSVARWFTFTAYAVLLGGAVTVLLVVSRTSPLEALVRGLFRHLVVAAAPFVVAGAMLQLVDQHEALGGSWGSLLAETRFGTFWLIRQLLALVVFVAAGLAVLAAARGLPRVERALYVLIAATSAAALGTISLVGHAAAAPGRFWAISSDFVHLVVAAIWVGGLVVLAVLGFTLRADVRRNGVIDLLPLVARFSLLASGAMYVLVVTGIVRSLGQLPTMSMLVDTSYGRWLLVKLALIAFSLLVALLNRGLLRRARNVRNEEKARLARLLRRTLSLEAGLACAVLLSVAALGQTPPPPRAVNANAPVASFIDVRQGDDIRVHLEVTPAQAGPNELRVHVFRPDGSDPGLFQRVTLTLISGPEARGGTVVEPTPQGGGLFVARGVMFGLVTDWEIRVDVQRFGKDDVRTSYAVPITRGPDEPEAAGSFSTPAPQLTRNALTGLGLAALAAASLLLSRTRPRNRRATPMALSGVVLMGALFVVGSGPITQGARTATPESIAQGRALYAENCVGGHGTEGLGDGPLAVSMTPPPANLPFHLPQHGDPGIRAVLAKGIPAYGMPGWGDRLSPVQLEALLDFLRAEFDRGPITPGAATGGRP